MTTTLDALLTQQQQQQADSLTAYRDLVRRAARDEPFSDGEDVFATLAAAGKSTRDLQSDVDHLRHRITLRRQLDDVPAIEQRIRAAEQALKELTDEFNRVEREYYAACAPHETTLRECRQQLQAAQTARQELLRGISPELLAEQRHWQGCVESLRHRLGEASRTRNSAQSRRDEAASRLGTSKFAGEEHIAAVNDFARHQAVVDDLQRQIAAAEQQLAAVHQRMLEP